MDTFYLHSYCPCSRGHFGCRVEKSQFHSCKQKEHDISGRDVDVGMVYMEGKDGAGFSVELFIVLEHVGFLRKVD